MATRAVLAAIEGEYVRYEALARSAIEQLDETQLRCPLVEGGNSTANLIAHVAGNLSSRFTDFLSADGEKPWRNREQEFQLRSESRAELMERWRSGWDVLFATLSALDDGQLEQIVRIRGVELSVIEALQRSLAHAAYHVGQIVLVARTLRGPDWRHLSIAPGQSMAYNRKPDREKPPTRREDPPA